MNKVESKLNMVRVFAGAYDWEEFEYQTDSYCIRLTKEGFVINIWLSKMTVAIVYAGKQTFIKNVSDIKMEQILINTKNFIK